MPVQQAAGGSIGPGDLVDVIASDGEGGAYYVAQGLHVVSVAPTSSGGGVLGGGTGNYYVVVAVDKQTALRLAAALAPSSSSATSSQVQVVRSTGEAVTSQVTYAGAGSGAPGRKAP